MVRADRIAALCYCKLLTPLYLLPSFALECDASVFMDIHDPLARASQGRASPCGIHCRAPASGQRTPDHMCCHGRTAARVTGVCPLPSPPSLY